MHSVLYRDPPKLIVDAEYLAERGPAAKAQFLLSKQILVEHVEKLASDFGIDPSCWYVWDKSGITLTKVGSHLPVSVFENDEQDMDDIEQQIRVLAPNGKDSSPLVELQHSLVSVLSNYAL